MQVQLPCIIISTTIGGVSLVSFLLDRIEYTSIQKGRKNENPYKIFIQIKPFVNAIITFLFVSVSIIVSLVLIFFTK